MYDNVFCSGCGNQVCGCCGCCATAGCECCSCPTVEQEDEGEDSPEILIGVKIGSDGLCESCRLDLAAIQVASKRRCVSCEESEETLDGVIDLDETGRCDNCQDRLERALIYIEECQRSLDFDYSLNY